MLYTLAVQSAEQVASLVPVLLKQMSKTSSVWPLNVSIHLPDFKSHILHVLSIDPVAHKSPVNSN